MDKFTYSTPQPSQVANEWGGAHEWTQWVLVKKLVEMIELFCPSGQVSEKK